MHNGPENVKISGQKKLVRWNEISFNFMRFFRNFSQKIREID